MISHVVRFAVLLLAACTTGFAAQPSLIEGRQVSNAAVGFHGVTWTIPLGWDVFTPRDDLEAATNNAQIAWRMATDYDNGAGHTTHEIIALNNGSSGIAIAITTIARGRWPSERLAPRDYKKVLLRKAQTMKFPKGDVFVREVAVAGARSFAKVGRAYPVDGAERVNFVYMVPIAPTHEVSLNGVCSGSERKALELAMNRIVESMVTGK